MLDSSNDDPIDAVLTAATFLATLFMWIFAFLDALERSSWSAPEFAIGFACAVGFVSLLRNEPAPTHGKRRLV